MKVSSAFSSNSLDQSGSVCLSRCIILPIVCKSGFCSVSKTANHRVFFRELKAGPIIYFYTCKIIIFKIIIFLTLPLTARIGIGVAMFWCKDISTLTFLQHFVDNLNKDSSYDENAEYTEEEMHYQEFFDIVPRFFLFTYYSVNK